MTTIVSVAISAATIVSECSGWRFYDVNAQPHIVSMSNAFAATCEKKKVKHQCKFFIIFLSVAGQSSLKKHWNLCSQQCLSKTNLIPNKLTCFIK